VLTPAQRAELLPLDKAASEAVAVARSLRAGSLGDGQSTLDANAETRARVFARLHARLAELLELERLATPDEVRKLADALREVADLGAAKAAVAATDAGAAVVGAAKDTFAQLKDPSAWPPWLRWSLGGVVVVVLAVALAPRILGAVVGSLFGGRTR
jgi:hypothetical protein